MRVNLTHIALPVPLVDFSFGILPHVHGTFFDAAAAFKISRSQRLGILSLRRFVFASRANFIVIKFVAKAQNFKILPPLTFGAEHK